MVISVYAVGLITRGNDKVLTGLAYNAPIALLFLVLGTEIIVHIAQGGIGGIRERAPILLLWLAGFAVLYLRLAKRIEVSGHMAWLPLLTAQAWLVGFPRWFTAFAAASTVLTVFLKFVVFRGPSGVPGIVVGMTLAMALLLVERRQRSRISRPSAGGNQCASVQTELRHGTVSSSSAPMTTRSGTTTTRNDFAPPS